MSNNLDYLQSIWNELDLGYEHMERAIENLSEITNLPVELEKMIEQYDLSEISILKQEVEELMERVKSFPRIVYTENGQPAGDLAENERRNEILRMNQELCRQYPVHIKAKDDVVK